MSYQSEVIDRVFFVRWLQAQATDMPKIFREVVNARRATKEGPLIYIAIAPVEAPPPEDAARKAMTDAIPSLLEHCESVHLVIEGDGFRMAIIRSIASGMFLVSGKRGKVFPHSTVEEALAAIAGSLREAPDMVLRKAIAKKLVIPKLTRWATLECYRGAPESRPFLRHKPPPQGPPPASGEGLSVWTDLLVPKRAPLSPYAG